MIECRAIAKEFGEPPQTILHGLDFQIQNGEFVSISGKSGSGKSTLLYLISTLDRPTSGSVYFDGTDITEMNSDQIHAFRNRNIGFIFQFHFLLPDLTAIENILLPARNLGLHREMVPEARQLLHRMGIGAQEKKLPSAMSGGEQQRVAIARALIMKPKYVFADEPTGNLDSENAENVMSLLKETHENGTTVCLVTHDPDFAGYAQREIHLVDGRISASKPI